MNYLKYYDQEKFLFEDVQSRFKEAGKISVFDFHCILIWKANRAKNMHIARLCKNYGCSYEKAVANLILGLVKRESPKERLQWMMTGPGSFRLPTATAILAVLYPNEFTVYDIRVCKQLVKLVKKNFHGLKDKRFTDTLWDEYGTFKKTVEICAPQGYSLRDKDRYLWGKSFLEQIRDELKKTRSEKV